MMGTAEAIAMITTSTAKILPPIVPSLTPAIRVSADNALPPQKRRAGSPQHSYLVRLRFEREIDGFCLVPGDGHILGLSSVVLMPGGDGIFPWRQIRKRERPAVASNGIVVGFEYSEPSMHPRMDLALHRDELGI